MWRSIRNKTVNVKYWLNNFGGNNEDKPDHDECSDVRVSTDESANDDFITQKSLSSVEEAFLSAAISLAADENFFLLKYDGEFRRPTEKDFRKFEDAASSDSFAVALQSSQNGQFCIIWHHKSETFALSMTDDIYPDDLDELCHFITKFLINCINENHSGVECNIISPHNVFLTSLYDQWNFNLFFHAARLGNTNIVRILLETAFSVNTRQNDLLAIDYAYKHMHFETVLELLNANSPFPSDFNFDVCSHEGLKAFADKINYLHANIKAGNLTEIENILAQHSDLSYYYGFDNTSAPAAAIKYKQLEAYKMLMEKKILFSPHENEEELIDCLSDDEREKIRDIHFELKKNVQVHHLNILLSKSYVGHDEHKTTHKLQLIMKSYRALNCFKPIEILLKIAALLTNLYIVFDFKRDSVYFMDPRNSDNKNADGLFSDDGRICIGASQLLNPDTVHITMATIAHEFCHYILYVVFENLARPYREDEKALASEFELISEECKQKIGYEDIIDLVYELYPPESHHAELIVRVPHILAHYFQSSEDVDDLKEQFKTLFDFYEEKLMPKLEDALVELETRAEREVKEKMSKKNKKISLLTKISIVLAFFLPILAIIGYYVAFEPTYSWNELDSVEKSKVLNGTVMFLGDDFKFRELFGTNDTNNEVFVILDSQQLKILIEGEESLDLSEPQNKELERQINLVYSNSSEKLKEKIRNAKVEFQGQNITFNSIVGEKTEIYELFDSSIISKLFKNEKFVIGEKLENDVSFYIDRNFLIDGIDIFEQDKIFHIDIYNNTQKRNFSISALDLLLTSNSSFFLLSDVAGSGKTTTSKQLSVVFKEKFKQKWIHYVDLKDHIPSLERIQRNGFFRIPEDLIDVLKITKNYEIEIFKKSWEDKNLVVFWDGFDEVSPDYSRTLLQIFDKINDKNQTFQLVFTRRDYEIMISKMMLCDIYHLFPYLKEENDEYLRKFYALINLTPNRLNEALKNVENLTFEVQKSEKNGDIRNYIKSPLLLKMIAEISVSIDYSKSNSISMYSIYENFMYVKINITLGKGELSRDEIIKRLKNRETIMEIFQYFAIEHLNRNKEYENILENLDITKHFRNHPEKLSKDELSRYGIFSFHADGQVDSVHHTFNEFFLARYFLNKVHEEEESIDESELCRRLELLVKVLPPEPSYSIQEFIIDYLRNKTNFELPSKILKIFEQNHNKIFFQMFDAFKKSSFRRMLQWLPFKNEELERLWKYKENGTLTSFLLLKDYSTYMQDLTEIELLLDERFPNQTEKHNQMIFGKNQVGTFNLIGFIHSYGITKFFKEHKLDFNFNLAAQYRRESSVNSFYENVMKPKMTVEERREFFSKNFMVFSSRNRNFMPFEWNLEMSIEEIFKLFNEHEAREIICRQTEHAQNNPIGESILTHITDKNVFQKIFNIALENCPPSSIFDFFFVYDVEKKVDILGITCELLHNDDFFDFFWNFLANHTNTNQKRKVLSSTIYNKICKPSVIMTNPIFTESLLYGPSFDKVSILYDEFFNKTEMIYFCNLAINDYSADISRNRKLVKYLQHHYNNSEILQNFEYSLTEYYLETGHKQYKTKLFIDPLIILLKNLIPIEKFNKIKLNWWDNI